MRVGGISTFAGLHADKNSAANTTVARLIDRGSFGHSNMVMNLSVVIWPLLLHQQPAQRIDLARRDTALRQIGRHPAVIAIDLIERGLQVFLAGAE
jgi:hypothetical protein